MLAARRVHCSKPYQYRHDPHTSRTIRLRAPPRHLPLQRDLARASDLASGRSGSPRCDAATPHFETVGWLALSSRASATLLLTHIRAAPRADDDQRWARTRQGQGETARIVQG